MPYFNSSLWSHIFLLHSCNEPGMGPLMRDVKNKICTGNNLGIMFIINYVYSRLKPSLSFSRNDWRY